MCSDHDFHTSVVGAPLAGVVRRDRLGFSLTFRADTVLRHTLAGQVVAHALRTLLGEREVGFIASTRVRVAFDDDALVGVDITQSLGDIVQLLLRERRQFLLIS